MRVTETNRISLERIAQAADVIDPVFLDSHQFGLERLEGRLGCHLVVKVEDGRDAALAEGAGTIGLELLRSREAFDSILVPLGDGSLLAGVARWVKAHDPATRMVGVCSSGAPSMEHSWRTRQVQKLQRAETIADGIAVRTPFPEAL